MKTAIPRSIRRRGAVDEDGGDDDDDGRKRPDSPRPSDDRSTSKQAPKPPRRPRLLKYQESQVRTIRSVFVSSCRLLQNSRFIPGKTERRRSSSNESSRTNRTPQSSNTDSKPRFRSLSANPRPLRDRPRNETLGRRETTPSRAPIEVDPIRAQELINANF